MDLEEKLLSFSLLREGEDEDKRPEEDSEGSAGELSDDEDAVAKSAPARKDDLLAERTEGYRTGIKGVLADKRWSDELAAKQHDRTAMESWHAVRTIAYGSQASTLHTEDGFLVDGSTAAAPPPATASGVASDAEEDSEIDSEDDEFFQQYRAQRLAALKQQAALPAFGKVKMLNDKDAFADAVDAVDSRAYCLVYLYEPFIPECRTLLHLLPALAASFPHTCFMAMTSACISETIDVIGLPAFMVYKAGATVEVMVRVCDEIGSHPTLAEVEGYLIGKGYATGTSS